MSNLALYIVGYLILIGGLAWGAHVLGISPTWIAIGAVVLLGFGVVTGVSRTRRPEDSPADD
jgi:hypothetical protein